MRTLLSRSLQVCSLGVCAAIPLLQAHAETEVEFNRDIRPLLDVHCVKCHGGVKEAGDLHLLFRNAALKGGKSGLPAIVPGKPEASELIARITTKDEDDRMPLNADPLNPEQIALLNRWITAGANWQEHWAYVPPKSQGLGIDNIVEKRLATEKLSLSREVDRRTLARRTSLDLTGLPPSPEEVDLFVKDRSPDAYDRWLDRLLASPAYGERWAATWLDMARYADSKGYEKDDFRDMWRYRDWVVDALNDDMPYDQFLVEQLAGDLLPAPSDEQVIATAFHRNTLTNDEGGTDDEEFRTYAVIDRLNTTFDVVQGTTMGCAQCHGHPYDAFTHREYYELLAFFNNTADSDRNDEFPTREFYAPPDMDNAAKLKREISKLSAQAQLEVGRRISNADNRKAFEAWLREVRPAENQSLLQNLTVSSTEGTYAIKENGKVLLQDKLAPYMTTITVEGTATSDTIGAIILEALTDESLPNRGPGGERGGHFVVTHFSASLVTEGRPDTILDLSEVFATHEQKNWPVSDTLRKDKGRFRDFVGWANGGGSGRPQTATFVIAKPFKIPTGTRLRVRIECENEPRLYEVLGAFRLSTLSPDGLKKLAVMPQDVRNLLYKSPTEWTANDRASVEGHFLSASNTELAAFYMQMESSRVKLANLPACRLPVMRELAGTNARVTRIFHKGNWLDKTDTVTHATPKVLNPWREDYSRNRLGLAKWLTNGENPLTARVHVNRIWEQLFGIGLVETLEDFGSQGDKPVYQELLDEMAVQFQTEMKWSQKKLLRQIVLSQTYRQSSKASAALLERDPANRLLARGPRFRLSSEQLRDQALTIGGTLSRKMFGPPVMPYQPPGMWLTPYEGRDWVNDTEDNGRRRALYTFLRRSATYPSFVTFDTPSREFCTVRRQRTITPAQSLDLLNNPVFFEAAKGLAKRMAAEGGNQVEAQLHRGFLLATLRPPAPSEIAALQKLHTRVNGNLTLVANAILNLDEVINKN